MPRFYFDVISFGERIDDIEGQELPDLETARREGTRAAREILAHDIMRGEKIDDPVLEIRDAAGDVLERLPFKTTVGL